MFYPKLPQLLAVPAVSLGQLISMISCPLGTANEESAIPARFGTANGQYWLSPGTANVEICCPAQQKILKRIVTALHEGQL
jgi:hypothetical protein